MRTINMIFTWIFAALGTFALVAVIAGATHQLAIAGICALMSLMMWNADREDK